MSDHIETANKLYETVKNLSHDLKSTDGAKANLIIEYAEDAIAAYGNTSQDKKVELRELIKATKEIIPPETFRDLTTIVQSKLLKIIYPKNPAVRNILFILVALVIIGPSFVAIRSIFPTVFSKSKAITNELETLPNEELKKLLPEGDGGGTVWVAGNGRVSYNLYNGSDYKLKEIIVRIRLLEYYSHRVLYDENISLPLDSESSGEPFTKTKFSRDDFFPSGVYGKTESKGIISGKGVRVHNTTP